MAKPIGNVKGEHTGPGGKINDTFTPDSGTAEVARVMRKAEAVHQVGSKTTEGAKFKLETNQAKHVSGDGSDNFGQR